MVLPGSSHLLRYFVRCRIPSATFEGTSVKYTGIHEAWQKKPQQFSIFYFFYLIYSRVWYRSIQSPSILCNCISSWYTPLVGSKKTNQQHTLILPNTPTSAAMPLHKAGPLSRLLYQMAGPQQAEVFSASSEQQLYPTSLVYLSIGITLVCISFQINTRIKNSLSVSFFAPLGAKFCPLCPPSPRPYLSLDLWLQQGLELRQGLHLRQAHQQAAKYNFFSGAPS